jgi:hypothetical protein
MLKFGNIKRSNKKEMYHCSKVVPKSASAWALAGSGHTFECKDL